MQKNNWNAISRNRFFIIFKNYGRFKVSATVKGLTSGWFSHSGSQKISYHMDESAILGETVLTTVQITLSFTVYGFPVAMQFFSQNFNLILVITYSSKLASL